MYKFLVKPADLNCKHGVPWVQLFNSNEEIRCQMTSSMPVLTTLIVAWHARLLNTTSRRTPRSLLNALQRMPQNIQQISISLKVPFYGFRIIQIFQGT